MYIDLIIFIILIAVVLIFFRKFSSIVYAIFIIDLTLRALTYIKWNINLLDIKNVINNYIPENVPAMDIYHFHVYIHRLFSKNIYKKT